MNGVDCDLAVTYVFMQRWVGTFRWHRFAKKPRANDRGPLRAGRCWKMRLLGRNRPIARYACGKPENREENLSALSP